jgi:DNA invertase Pin-like site-specific DNA recombinase
MTPKAQLYARLSTHTQADEGQSLNTQVSRMIAACQEHGLQPVGVELDDRHSGRGGERPGLYRALDRIAQWEADLLVVADVDRLTRSVADWQAILQWFHEADADVFDVGLQQYLCSEPGRTVASWIVHGAEREAVKTGERTRAVLQHKRARGEVTGRPRV